MLTARAVDAAGLLDRLCAAYGHLARRCVIGDPSEVDDALEAHDVVFLVGAELAELVPPLRARAYVTHVRLTPSEIFALTGGPVDAPIEAAREVLILEPRSADARARALPADLGSDVFRVGAWAATLRRALDRGYRFVGFAEALSLDPADDGRYLLLRHDVEVSPDLAGRVAELEAELGVSSAWFFMISGGFYDLLAHRAVVRRVRALGHTLGFHYDACDDIAEGLDILSVVAGQRVAQIAQHNPSLVPRPPLERPDVVDAYDARLTGPQRFVYVSDSGMRWRGKPLDALVEEGTPRIYALCHPESWLTEGRDLISALRFVEEREHEERRRRFDAFVAGNIEYLRRERR